MFKLLVVTVAALYTVLIVFGDEARRPEVARQSNDDVTGLTLAAFTDSEIAGAGTEDRSPSLAGIDISEEEAVQLALAAGARFRSEREAKPLRGRAAADIASATTSPEASGTSEAPGLWYVTGTTVNLRSGPGTGNPVVGQVSRGDAAEVLDRADGWYRIRTDEDGTDAWISGRFLTEGQPG